METTTVRLDMWQDDFKEVDIYLVKDVIKFYLFINDAKYVPRGLALYFKKDSGDVDFNILVHYYDDLKFEIDSDLWNDEDIRLEYTADYVFQNWNEAYQFYLDKAA